MPLHLLGKKSWNVYNNVNIEKVKRDEAAAAALEAQEEERMQEADALRRMQILRGETPTPLVIEDTPRPSNSTQDGSGSAARESGYGREKKRRKKFGENDTDFEMRIAAEERDKGLKVNQQLVLRKPVEAPIVDQRGHISLFPENVPSISKTVEKNPEAEREAARKKKEYEDQYTMRFSNAAGFKQGLEKPWYSLSIEERTALREDEEKALVTRKDDGRERRYGKDRYRSTRTVDTKGKEDYGGEIPHKDVWGNEDPRRKERVLSRMVDNDPLAAMKAGASQVRRVEKERKALREEREREMKELDDIERRRRRDRKRERDEFEDFRLDEPVRDPESERKRKRRQRDIGSLDDENLEYKLEKRSFSRRHEDPEKESEKDRGGRHRHKESSKSSHRDESRHQSRNRSRHHDHD
ncbi:uncharacterized protein RAG0_03334 [Rhynchosporium agropyri]|uniref:CBF1-interacting co-repressor CIR N-terminal domain-containing protein n=1 Tax=Rhynchosporium agropyri TaxID=914238 RepID=A0A1E1K4B0_9HELO|nr:uncharacterized protein RAG0_03334 [Rhynchosporium agropyri]